LQESCGIGMLKGFDIDELLTNLAKRVAAEVRAEMEQSGSAMVIRPRLLTVEQGAVYLGRTKEAVQHMLSAGKIPRVQSDRRIFLDTRDLDRWIEDHKQPMV